MTTNPTAPQDGGEKQMLANIAADAIVMDVAELPDRTSPDDWPDAMLVTQEELREIVLRNLASIATPDLAAVRDEALEEAVTAARDAMVAHEWPPQDGDVQIDEVLAAIRALQQKGPSNG